MRTSPGLAFLVGVCIRSIVAEAAPTVTVENGVFVGTTSAVPGATQVANRFLGIPFAVTPPVRFERSVKAPNSTEIRNATSYGPNCLQSANIIGLERNMPPPTAPVPEESEDCLYINVYAPASPPPAGGYAVMFWIYGGAFAGGGGSLGTYDGSKLAALHNVIIVTSNYRTNLFGFPDPMPTSPPEQANFGLLDVKLAFEWTRKNIAAFGGDPEKITLFGESAGAIIVDFLYLTTPSSKPPFRGVIMQSGSYYLNDNGIGLLGPQTGGNQTRMQQLSMLAGCGYDDNTLACLRSMPGAYLVLMADALNIAWSPLADGGSTVPLNMAGNKIRLSGGGARVPTLLGTNADEAIIFLAFGAPVTFQSLVNSTFPELAPYEAQIRAAYPIGGCSPTGCWTNELDAASQAATDYLFNCPAAREARATAQSGVPVWRYYFNRTTVELYPTLPEYVTHMAEMSLVFGTYKDNVTANDKATSAFMMKAWTDFAKNPTAGPGWNAFTGATSRNEIAQLGGPSNPNGRFDTNVTVIDYACHIYEPIYNKRDPPKR